MRLIRPVLVSVLLISAACSSSPDATPTAAPRTTAPPAPASPAAQTPDATQAPAEPCEDAPLSPEATPAGDAVSGDFDGDGAADEFNVYLVEGEELVAYVFFAAGGSSRVVIGSAGPGPARAFNAVTVDGDADDEAWAVVGAGASSELYALFDVDGCALTRPELDGGPNVFSVGASVNNSTGVACDDTDDDGDFDTVTEYTASRQDGDAFELRQRVLELQDGALTVTDTSDTVVGENDAVQTAEFACGTAG